MQAPGKLSSTGSTLRSRASTPRLYLVGWVDSGYVDVSGLCKSRYRRWASLRNPGFSSGGDRVSDLTDSLLDAIPALIHHWTTPAPLSHRIIIPPRGMWRPPYPAARAGGGPLAHCRTRACLVVLAPASRPVALRATLLAVSGLWLLGSSAHLNQVSALMQSPTKGAATSAGTVALDGAHLLPLVTTIKQSPALEAAPMLTASLDGASQFEAQRLPFMALPTSAVAVDASRLGQIAPNFRGTVVLLESAPPAQGESR